MASTHPFIQGLLGVVVGGVLPYEILRNSPLQFCGFTEDLQSLREFASAPGRTTGKGSAFLQKGLTFSSLEDQTTFRAFQNNHFSSVFEVMFANVFAVVHHLKVFNPVVFLIPVFMVHNFIGIEKPAKVILDYDSMFQHIAISRSLRMSRNKSVVVISLVDDLLNLPHRTLLLKSVALSI